MATQATAGSAPGRASSPYGAYSPATPFAVRDRATASSSQPTGWRGRRPASTAPTVAALTIATNGPTAVSRGRGQVRGRGSGACRRPHRVIAARHQQGRRLDAGKQVGEVGAVEHDRAHGQAEALAVGVAQ